MTSLKHCRLGDHWLDRSAFDGKDCRDCRRLAATRPARGQAPAERLATPWDFRRQLRVIRAEAERSTGVRWAIDQIVPIRSKRKRP